MSLAGRNSNDSFIPDLYLACKWLTTYRCYERSGIAQIVAVIQAEIV
ncbi:MAG TPA: hypothetical protein VKY57_17580 [Chitinispirillaceae bacterium]|nr:hypothetical protein [Chitinispirillaceae bacterium]